MADLEKKHEILVSRVAETRKTLKATQDKIDAIPKRLVDATDSKRETVIQEWVEFTRTRDVLQLEAIELEHRRDVLWLEIHQMALVEAQAIYDVATDVYHGAKTTWDEADRAIRWHQSHRERPHTPEEKEADYARARGLRLVEATAKVELDIADVRKRDAGDAVKAARATLDEVRAELGL